ncbi:response regulator transcription factor [Ramlibacter rhizophilus]|nr:response regulator transcription factor [Ramlibacter rhizophilus]
MATSIELGRQAFLRREWKEAFRQLKAGDAESPLEPADLERLAQAAYLIGRDADATALFMRAHYVSMDAGAPERAARWAFWLSLNALLGGDIAQSTGWLARIQRIVGTCPDCAEQGYVDVLSGLAQLGQGHAENACAIFGHAISRAVRFKAPDLMAMSLLGQGQALIQIGRAADGVPRLDEAMVTVAAGEVSAMAAGIVYCAVILTCQRLFDLRRCKEWTRALDEWCAEQPDLVPYRGECLVHRSEILQLEGEWSAAMTEAQRAVELFATRRGPVSGRAYYQLAELHRLRGKFSLAEEMYGEAGRRGTEPQPGLSLLRLAQRDFDVAKAAISRVTREASHGHGIRGAATRPLVLHACVEIMIATGDVEAARQAAVELESIAADVGALVLHAWSGKATGTVLLAQDDAQAALAVLRDAWQQWQELDSIYESAEVRVLIGRACLALGDEDTAHSHFEAAARTFERLGATPALAEVGKFASAGAAPSHLLSRRELEVLRLVAKGQSNREIAARLFISEHTVARHLSSILGKLGVASRTAASAFAFEHGLI